jgi:hypothetical protein
MKGQRGCRYGWRVASSRISSWVPYWEQEALVECILHTTFPQTKCVPPSLCQRQWLSSPNRQALYYPISWEIVCPFLLWKSWGAMLQSILVHESFLTRNDIGFLSFHKVTTILYVLRGVFYSSSCPCSVRGCFVLIDRIEVNGICNISYVEMRHRLHMWSKRSQYCKGCHTRSL